MVIEQHYEPSPFLTGNYGNSSTDGHFSIAMIQIVRGYMDLPQLYIGTSEWESLQAREPSSRFPTGVKFLSEMATPRMNGVPS